MTKEIINQIGVGEKNKATIYKTRSKVELWWESKDKWFCNIKTKNEDESYWVIEKDLHHHLNFAYLNNGYKIK